MIIALWNRWRTERSAAYLLALVALIVADAFLGVWLIAWEIELARKAF